MIHPDVLYICDYKVTLRLCQSDILILIELSRIGTISTNRGQIDQIQIFIGKNTSDSLYWADGFSYIAKRIYSLQTDLAILEK